jgi:hypothetical protein
MNHHQDIVSSWLENVGRERGISLGLGNDGHCVIVSQEGWSCVIEVPASPEVPAIFIYLPIAKLPDDPGLQIKWLRFALEMNSFGLLTGGSHIALDGESNYLIMSFSALVDAIDENDFKHVLNDLLELAIPFRERFHNLELGSSAKSQKVMTEKKRLENLMRTSLLKKNTVKVKET